MDLRFLTDELAESSRPNPARHVEIWRPFNLGHVDQRAVDEEQGCKEFHDDAIPEDSLNRARSRIAQGQIRAESRECEQLPNGQIGKTGCGNGTGTALTGDWPAGSLWPHRNARSAPFVVGSRRQNGCPATDRHNVDGAPSNYARDGRDDPPWRQSTWAWLGCLARPREIRLTRGTTSDRHTDRHTCTHTMPHSQPDQHTRKHTHTHTHTYPSTHAELTFSAATNCGGGQSDSCVMPVATLFSFF
jgi:hypothetical protein